MVAVHSDATHLPSGVFDPQIAGVAQELAAHRLAHVVSHLVGGGRQIQQLRRAQAQAAPARCTCSAAVVSTSCRTLSTVAVVGALRQEFVERGRFAGPFIGPAGVGCDWSVGGNTGGSLLNGAPAVVSGTSWAAAEFGPATGLSTSNLQVRSLQAPPGE